MNVEKIIRENMSALLRKAFLEDKEFAEMRESLLEESKQYNSTESKQYNSTESENA